MALDTICYHFYFVWFDLIFFLSFLYVSTQVKESFQSFIDQKEKCILDLFNIEKAECCKCNDCTAIKRLTRRKLELQIKLLESNYKSNCKNVLKYYKLCIILLYRCKWLIYNIERGLKCNIMDKSLYILYILFCKYA